MDNVAPLFSDLIHATAPGGATWRRDELVAHGVLTDTGIALGPFPYGAARYAVRVWQLNAEHHTQYLLEQPELWGRVAVHYKGDRPEPDIYGVPEGVDPFPRGAAFPAVTTPHAMAEFQRKRYVIFARAVAALYAHGAYDLLIGNDYHVGLAAFYDPNLLQFTIGHNLSYQGVDGLYFRDREAGHCVSISLESVRAQAEAYCDLLGVPVSALYEYFLAFRDAGYVGTPVWLQAILRLNFDRCGLAATTVSQHYADQLRLTRDDIEVKIRAMRDFTPDDYFDPAVIANRVRSYWRDNTEHFGLFVPSQNLFDLTQYHIVGVLNGLDARRHLRHDADLLRQLGFAAMADRAPEERIRDAEELAQVKRAARRALFADRRLAARGLTDRGQAIHLAWGRLVEQKAFHILLEEAAHITQRREEVLVVVAFAPANDVEGLYLEQRFAALADQIPSLVFVNAFDPEFVRLARVAADVAHHTSKYEPCGLADVEAYWSGTLCVVHKVGGLVKGLWDEPGYSQVRELEPRGEPVAFGYDCFDTTDVLGGARAFRRAYEALLDLREQEPRRFEALQFKALNMLQFTYAIPANRYIDLIQYVLYYQVWRKLKADINAGRITAAEGVEAMRAFLDQRAHLDDNPDKPALYSLFRDVFRPPDLYYVDELDRLLSAHL
ncbi:MAG: glycosyltransferase [Anaerolineae bacterium]|nr:glycosyltransferase [Anaerolineae bacterium]